MKLDSFYQEYVINHKYDQNNVVKKALKEDRKGKLLYKVVKQLVNSKDKGEEVASQRISAIMKSAQEAALMKDNGIDTKINKKILKKIRKYSKISSSKICDSKSSDSKKSSSKETVGKVKKVSSDKNSEKKTQKMSSVGRGIINSGSMCYFISSIKALCGIPQFRKFVAHSDHPIAQKLHNVFQELSQKDKECLKLTKDPLQSFINDLKMSFPSLGNGVQQDAEEFLTTLLTEMNYPMIRWLIIKSSAPTDKEEQVYEHRILPVVVPTTQKGEISIQHLMDRTKEMRRIGDLNFEEKTSLRCLDKAPQEVFVQVVKFNDEMGLRKDIKIKNPESLIIKEAENKEAHYSLYSVIAYSGSGKSGHYYSLVRDGANWILHDDTSVVQKSNKKALEVIGKEGLIFGYQRDL